MNIIISYAFWLWIVKVLIISGYSMWMILTILKIQQELIKFNSKALIRIIIMGGILGLGIFLAFGGYGRGQPVFLSEVKHEGINQIMEKIPEEDIEAAAKSAKSKEHKAIKQVKENLNKDEDETFKRALEGALKNQRKEK